jgi:uncharacterized membrane protein YhhN
MTAIAWFLLCLAGSLAVADWVAVWRRSGPRADGRSGRASSENVLKPLVLVAVIAVALALHPADGAQRAWFVVALVLSLAGDVFLLPSVDRYVPGLASFLLAHVAYVIGFAVAGRGDGSAAGAVFVLALLAPGAVRVIGAVRRDEPELAVPVVVYITVISTMVAAAHLHGDGLGFVGAVLFAGSDTTLALDRFVEHRRWMPTVVMVTYHVAQGLLVLSLVR